MSRLGAHAASVASIPSHL